MLNNYINQYINFTSKYHPPREKNEKVPYQELNHYSFFFRDTRSNKVASYINKRAKREDRNFKVTSLGCSYGQEVYSYAMKFAQQGLKNRVELYGYDLSKNSIEYAIEGIYDFNDHLQGELNTLLKGEYGKYFTSLNNGDLKIRKNLLPKCNFIEKDIRKTGIEPESQSVVIMNNVMYHIAQNLSEEKRKEACEDMAHSISEIIEPNGIFVSDDTYGYGWSKYFHNGLINSGLKEIEDGIYQKMPQDYNEKISNFFKKIYIK